MNSSIFTWKETIAMGMICVAVVSLALSPNERLFPLLILTAIALITVAALIVSKRRRTSADGYKRQRIELRLTGLNKIEEGGLCLAIRTIEGTRSFDELSTLCPPAGSIATREAAQWAASYMEKHPERGTYQAGALIIDVSASDYTNDDPRDWVTLNRVVDRVIGEVARQQPAITVGTLAIQPAKDIQARLASYAHSNPAAEKATR
ncbi:hypothetical protein [Actinomyces naeslundii]|uniref:hypothetical protein n=1 Tax=Actinomyces naeslundii TaxID=1655 RepID=UPI00117820EB|nr:hypothetical protein [Actinomyces naeslundii]